MSVAEPAVTVSMEPEFLDKETTCQVLGGISAVVLDRLVRKGEITPKVIGSRVVFPVEEVRRFARDCKSWEPKR